MIAVVVGGIARPFTAGLLTPLSRLSPRSTVFLHPLRALPFTNKMSSEPTARQPHWHQPEGQGKVQVYNSLTRSKVLKIYIMRITKKNK